MAITTLPIYFGTLRMMIGRQSELLLGANTVVMSQPNGDVIRMSIDHRHGIMFISWEQKEESDEGSDPEPRQA